MDDKNVPIPIIEQIVMKEKIALIYLKYFIALSRGPASDTMTVQRTKAKYKNENISAKLPSEKKS